MVRHWSARTMLMAVCAGMSLQSMNQGSVVPGGILSRHLNLTSIQRADGQSTAWLTAERMCMTTIGLLSLSPNIKTGLLAWMPGNPRSRGDCMRPGLESTAWHSERESTPIAFIIETASQSHGHEHDIS